MAYIPKQNSNTGLYVPSTYTFDVEELADIEVTSPEFKELLVRLYQNINNMNIALNNKDSGFYVLEEFLNSQLFFNPNNPDPNKLRNVFRTTVDFGALPAAGTKSVAHGITTTADFNLTRIYGAATDPAGRMYIPLPYASPVLADNIELWMDATFVNVKVGKSQAAFTRTIIVIEYVKF